MLLEAHFGTNKNVGKKQCGRFYHAFDGWVPSKKTFNKGNFTFDTLQTLR